MLPVSLDLALLKLQLPELVLRPGMTVVARVASRGDGSAASLVLAGALIRASVPEEVRSGDTLRLTVAETSPERVVLRLDANTPAVAPGAELAETAPMAAPPVAGHGLDPDGEAAGRDRAGDRPGVSLSYETAALGRLDLRIERGPEGVTVVVGTPAGTFPLAEARGHGLREALEARLGTQAAVRIAPRQEPFDAYA